MAPKPGYAAGNILNMLVQLGADLTGYDFSGLSVWGAYALGRHLRQVDLTYTDVRRSVFSDTFGSVLSVTFSPDGSRIAFGTTGGEVRLWDMVNGAYVAILSGHTNWVQGVVFHPNGQVIASGSSDHLRSARRCGSWAQSIERRTRYDEAR